MADVKWVKLTTDMFDNRKVKHLRRLPEGNNIVLIWVMLLTMAGRCNSGGMIFLTENIPYTPKMLADELDFEENTVILALQALESLDMIITDNGFFSIAGWEEYQNIEGMDKIREQNRLRQQKRRVKTKQALIGSGNVCEYCGNEGSTVDHLIPRAKGGLDVPDNTVCSCLSCNMKKTSKALDVFLNEMMATSADFELGRIISNKKIMRYVIFDDMTSKFVSRDVTLHVTQCHATDIEEDKDIDKDKDKEKRKKKESSYDEILSRVADDDLRELYLEYIKMRKMIKAPMTDRALIMLINKVNELEPNSLDNQKKLLETAIMNNWKSVYPLKDIGKADKKQPSKQEEELLKMFGE